MFSEKKVTAWPISDVLPSGSIPKDLGALSERQELYLNKDQLTGN